ncbi:MAG TPA: catalase [Acidimicrobiales bacterium]|jgi:catalase|nr:catalase [Acidimicrobiales bacterium]
MSRPEEPFTTSDAGIPAGSDEYSLTVGPAGPILLQDTYLVQKMQQFNRERIPERVVHAKGGGAFGFFEATEDVSDLTSAVLFRKGARTEMLARFSTVAGERGYADTTRDPRGFALKFYTEMGNYDMVGNNTPVFFVRDPQKFQDFIHSQKRRADNNLRDNNMQWDFWTLSPESAHQVTWLMGDRGLPKTWRHMNGYSSHTYMWINAAGQRSWVKYHFKTDQGVEHLTEDEGHALAGQNPDHHLEDLFRAIKSGDHPSWTLYVQVMPLDDAADYRFNPFDLTKVWPHGDYPLRKVGNMVLDRNPANYFAEIEQATFEPSNMIPGVGPSPDKMLLARLFSYHDTHLHRVGPNAQHLPVNQAKNATVHTYNRDGAMRAENPPDPVYAPNSYGGPVAQPEIYGADPSWSVSGEIVRSAYEAHREDDDFGQANAMVNVAMDDEARARLVSNVVGHVRQGVEEPVLSRVFDYWRKIDKTVGDLIEEGVRRPAK